MTMPPGTCYAAGASTGSSLRDQYVNLNVYSAGVKAGWTHDELYGLIVHDIPRSFRAGTEADRRALLESRPGLTDTPWDALIAATVEHVATLRGYEVPEWVDEPERFPRQPLRSEERRGGQECRSRWAPDH